MIHDELNLALAKWAEIVGPKVNGTIKNYDYCVSLDELNECQTLDDTGLTTAMVLRSLWDQFSSGIKVSLRDMIEKKPSALKKIRQYKELQQLLTVPAISEEIEAFQGRITDGLRFYGAEHAVPMVQEVGSLGLLRRDALRSMQTFSVHQFVQGVATTSKLRYSPMVYRFINIQSLVSAMVSHGEPGVALCHILDPDGLEFSYFAFSIWNGGTLTVVTDKRDYTHPFQKQMERCPARSLAERWGKHHFPYELLNAKFSDNAKHVTFEKKPGLVKYDIAGSEIASLWGMEPDVVIWLSMVFEQLQEKYFADNHLLPELSYTGDMVQKQVPVQNSLMSLSNWKPPTVPVYTSAALEQNAIADNFDRPTGHNRWLEDRYREQVPDALLNLVSDGKKLLPIPAGDDKRALRILKSTKGVLAAPSPYDFGTSQQLQRDNEFIARHNQARIIQQLASEEFEIRKDEILGWYVDKVQRNREFLIDAACRMELVLPSVDSTTFSRKLDIGNENMLSVRYFKSGHLRLSGWYDCGPLKAIVGEYSWQTGKGSCAILPDTSAGLVASIAINNPEAISIVTRTPIAELPDVLRHYTLAEPYVGNQILDRVDPMEWVVENPWRKLNLGIRVLLSRRGFNSRRKTLGLPVFSDWGALENK